jgi:AhpD family alkylhydroperoxidase
MRPFPRRYSCGRSPWRPREDCHQIMEQKVPNRMYPPATRELAQQRRDLARAQQASFDAFGKAVFADGALSAKMKQIIAVAVAHVTQCPYCIKGHTKAARRAGATPQELMEAIWVAAEMRAGGAYAHASLMLEVLNTDAE